MGKALGGNRGWTLTVAPQEEGVPTKTGEFDLSIELDLDEHSFLGKVLAHKLRKRKNERDGPVLELRHHRSSPRLFADAGEALKAVPVPTQHQLRHGGASHDASTGQRTLPEIKARGHWESDRSVKRYRKPGRMNEVVERLAPNVREYCLQAVEVMPAVLSGRLRPLPDP